VGLQPLACWDFGFESCRGTWTSVSCECCVLSGIGPWNGPITCPEESCRSVVCLSVISKCQKRGGPGPLRGCCARKNITLQKIIAECVVGVVHSHGRFCSSYYLLQSQALSDRIAEKSLTFRKLRCSLQSSQQPVTGPNPEPDESCLHSPRSILMSVRLHVRLLRGLILSVEYCLI